MDPMRGQKAVEPLHESQRVAEAFRFLGLIITTEAQRGKAATKSIKVLARQEKVGKWESGQRGKGEQLRDAVRQKVEAPADLGKIRVYEKPTYARGQRFQFLYKQTRPFDHGNFTRL
jgi:hypothetical protein